jgi:circadian clock protein KaiB
MVRCFRFTLYVAGSGPRPQATQHEFRQLCAQRLSEGEYEIVVIDVLAAIDQADAARILVTPTIVRTHPPPVLQVIGAISASSALADAIGLPREHRNGAR